MQRIYGFSWLNCQGQKVSMFENDFLNRKAFMNERARMKRRGIKVVDMKTTKPYNNPNDCKCNSRKK